MDYTKFKNIDFRIVLGLLFIIGFLHCNKTTKLDSKIQKKEFEINIAKKSIKVLNDSLTIYQVEIDSLVKVFEGYQAQLDGVVIQKDKIRIEYVDKIKNINSMSTNELDEFFSKKFN